MKSVAKLNSVTHQYGDVTAVDDLTLDIPSGYMVGLIGPDGVGKSTVMALISGVRKLQIGSVEVLGVDIDDAQNRNAICPRISYMPQGLGKNLYMSLSVYENIEFFARLFEQDKKERATRIEILLQSTGLTKFKDRPAGKLSGGMKQKLGLCCALIHDPDLLILDEPTTGVDPLSRQQFWALIDRIRANRTTMSVLVATAYMEEAEKFDHIIAMDEGKVLSSGSPQTLKEKTDTDNLDAWYEIYKDFLAEKTLNDLTEKESFTHAKLVSAYRSLRTNLPYLFTYKNHKHLHIYNTTNSLDGGVFSPMKMLIKIHRGLSKSLKLKMVDDYLLTK